MQNLVPVLRRLWKTPGFTLLVVMILALGIGVTTSILTLVSAALLKSLPYRDSSTLVSMTAADRSGNDPNGCLSYPHFRLLAENSHVLSSVAAFTNETFSSSGNGEPIELQAARVSSNFFDLLGVKPLIGRAFTNDEGEAAGNPVALISEGLWRRRFRANPNVAGQAIDLDSKSHTIIGVLPTSFQFGLLGMDIDVWTPRIDELSLATPQQIQGGTCYLSGIARLTPGVSIERARAEMKVLDRQYIRDFPKMGDADPNRPVELVPLKTKLVGNFRLTFLMLTAAVALVLLVACANVAGLLLTRALQRRREMAIRIAMGAGRGQVMAMFLVESMALAMLGGTAGVVLSLTAAHELVRTVARTFPRIAELPLGVDWSAIAFAFALSLVSGLLSGLTPALQLSSTNVSASLREEGRGTSGTRSRNLSRNVLVTGQIALSLILLVGAGLLIRSFILLESQSPGFSPEDVLKMNVALPPSKYSRPDQMIAFFDDLVQSVAALPGVKAAAISSALPANVARLTPMLVEGQAAVPLPERPIIIVQTFTSSYLRVLQVPLKKGRFFNMHDDRDSLPVIVINQSFAKKFFLGQNPIGKRVWIGRRTAPAQIVGVIGDIKNVSLSTEAQPEVDLPFAQLPWARMNLIVRTIGHPKIFTGAVRVQIAKLDRTLPVTDVETMDELLADESARPRMLMNLLAGLAVFAFVLSIVGLYGAINYSVAQRTQEMGVRIALGATRRDLLKVVLGYGTSVACVGIGIGIACSLVLTDAMKKLVYAITTKDPITFLVVPAAFLICALLASYLPARRALRVNVMDALRE